MHCYQQYPLEMAGSTECHLTVCFSLNPWQLPWAISSKDTVYQGGLLLAWHPWLWRFLYLRIPHCNLFCQIKPFRARFYWAHWFRETAIWAIYSPTVGADNKTISNFISVLGVAYDRGMWQMALALWFSWQTPQITRVAMAFLLKWLTSCI